LEPKHKRHLMIVIYPSRYHHTGLYYRGEHRIELRIPPDATKWRLAVLIAHEMHHAAGRRGGRSNEYWMRRSDKYGFTVGARELYSWVNDLPLDKQKPKAQKPKLTSEDKARAMLERTNKNIAVWETKLKRAKNALKKYNKTRKYYEKRLKR